MLNDDISNPGKHREVRDRATESNLAIAFEKCEAQIVPNHLFDHIIGAANSPVGLRQQTMRDLQSTIEIESVKTNSPLFHSIFRSPFGSGPGMSFYEQAARSENYERQVRSERPAILTDRSRPIVPGQLGNLCMPE